MINVTVYASTDPVRKQLSATNQEIVVWYNIAHDQSENGNDIIFKFFVIIALMDFSFMLWFQPFICGMQWVFCFIALWMFFVTHVEQKLILLAFMHKSSKSILHTIVEMPRIILWTWLATEFCQKYVINPLCSFQCL